MRVSLELRALICEREHPQDDNLNCRGQRGEKIVRILREGFFFFFFFRNKQEWSRSHSISACKRKTTTTQKQLKLNCYSQFSDLPEML